MKKISKARAAELRQLLNSRRSDMQSQVHGRIRDARSDRTQEVVDDVENSDAGAQQAIEFALIQMNAETARRIEQALLRLDAGEFGYCVECKDEIAEARLRALPFALRCTACEGRREARQDRSRQANQRHGSSLYSDTIGY
jgi:DnaK suppressor protein